MVHNGSVFQFLNRNNPEVIEIETNDVAVQEDLDSLPEVLQRNNHPVEVNQESRHNSVNIRNYIYQKSVSTWKQH